MVEVLTHQEQMLALLDIQEEMASRAERNQFDKFYPEVDNTQETFIDPKTKERLLRYYSRDKYPKSLAFWKAGADYTSRLFMAATQIGKTTSAMYEIVCHLTGRYPPWWEGRRFTGPNRWWFAGESLKHVKEVMQDKLIGTVDARGKGMIRWEDIDFQSMVDTQKEDTPVPTIRVRHHDQNGVYDGMSTIAFKSYEQGRKIFQGLPRNVWLDEEPNAEIYGEALRRLTSSPELMIVLTFTPLQGETPLIRSYLPNGERDTGPILEQGVDTDRYLVRAEDTEVPHITEKKREFNQRNIPEFQRDATRKGLPVLGSGMVYPMDKKVYTIESFVIPGHYKKVYGMDVGWNWTAAVWVAIDPQSGIKYIYAEHKMGETSPIGHAEVIRGRGLWIPGVIDSAANGRGQDGSEALTTQYRNLGLEIWPTKHKNVTAGCAIIWDALRAGQLKIMDNCVQTLREMASYSRDEKGQIMKVNDHLMDAMRYVVTEGSDYAALEGMNLGQADRYIAASGPSSQFRGVYG